MFLVLSLLSTFILHTNAGFWSGSGDEQEPVNVEINTKGDISNDKDTIATCETPIFPDLPNKLLAPLGSSTKATSFLVFITDKNSPWYCGTKSTLTAQAKIQQQQIRSRYSKTFIANSKSGSVRSTFGITKRTQLPAIAVIEPMTGKRYVLRNGEADLSSLTDLKIATIDVILDIFKRPKPLDLFDLSWTTSTSTNYQSMMDENVDLILIMVKSMKSAKHLVKDGLRRIAHSRKGSVRIVFSRDPQMWRRYGVSESSLPNIVLHNVAEDRTYNRGTVRKATDVLQVIDQIISERTVRTAQDVWNGNYPDKFHRVSWSPHLYVMDNFLTDKECQSMIDNAYPTLSTGSLVGDNINKKIKDLRFTVVPDNKITHVEKKVITRIHDNIRISEEHGEILQVSEYLPGQKYTIHPDSIDSGAGPHSMQRIVTFLMYLNDVEEGGSTIFPRGNGQNQHMTRHDTEPWNLQHFCNQTNTLKIKPKKGRAIFWYNHHTDLSWDQNTIHGACHVKQGIKYVAQRWIRWHTSQTKGFNPLQRSLNQAANLNRALDQQKRLNQATGKDQTKILLNKKNNLEAKLIELQQQFDASIASTNDLKQRVKDLGDAIPLHITPSSKASLWRAWMQSEILFLPVLNNIQNENEKKEKENEKRMNNICLLHENGCTNQIKAIYSSNYEPVRGEELNNVWKDGFKTCFRWSISRSPYARLIAFYDRLAVHNKVVSSLDKTWQKRLQTLGSFFEFIVGPVRMYHFSMTPTAGGDIGRHPGSRSQKWHLYDQNDHLLVNYVARYDNLQQDMLKICDSIECDKKMMKVLKNKDQAAMQGEDHEHVMKYFKSERVNLFEIVNDAFREDFDLLGYPKVNSIEEYQKKYVDQGLPPIVNM